MSDFTRFMKKNKVVKKNEMYAATASLLDENGKPLEWEFRHLTTEENEAIRDSCTKEIQITGKPNLFRSKTDAGLYVKRMIAASVVNPDLYNAELQDSYGVKTPEELLTAMVDNPGEYSELTSYVQKLHGFDIELKDKAEQAKN